MKRVLISLLLAWSLSAASAQLYVMGRKAPEVKIAEWIGPSPQQSGRYTYYEFFHTSSQASINNLAMLDRMAEELAGTVDVVVLFKEPVEYVAKTLGGGKHRFFLAADSQGRTFDAFEAEYVPLGALIDRRGRLVWLGNSSRIDVDFIKELIE